MSSGAGEAAAFSLETVDDADGLEGLRTALVDLVGAGARLAAAERLDRGVLRLLFETPDARCSLVVKELDPVIEYRNRMLAERWLPAVGLEDMCPALLAHAAEPSGRRSWQVYEDLGPAGLDRKPCERQRVAAAARAIAELHRRFADHAVLGECRLWGADLGVHFYRTNVRDAMRALEALAASEQGLPEHAEAACEGIKHHLQRMLDEEAARCGALEELGGPETLVHGDLWPMNVFVLAEDGGFRVRLIDWDHVGVARFPYDLSTFLARLPREGRLQHLAEYRDALGPHGWQLPDARTLNGLFDTSERARIASHVLWPALALLRGEVSLTAWALDSLVEVAGWFDALEPVLPCEEGARA